MNIAHKVKRYKRYVGTVLFICVLATCVIGPVAYAQSDQDEPESAPPVRKLIEIYRIAPGKHEEFLRFIAYLDDINIMAGLPARDLYVHNDGAAWDFIIIQPAKTPPDKAEALSSAWEEADAPSGANFFLKIREFIVEHTDTFATGPTSARNYLADVSENE